MTITGAAHRRWPGDVTICELKARCDRRRSCRRVHRLRPAGARREPVSAPWPLSLRL